MFERRLRISLVFFGIAVLVIFGRLTQLQIVQGDYYRQRALDALELPPTRLPFIRGSILERTGHVLVSDEPAWDLTIDFPIIALQFDPIEPALKREWRRWRKKLMENGHANPSFSPKDMENQLAQMWSDLADFCRVSRRDPKLVHARARELYDQIKNLRDRVAANRGFDAPVAEESEVHALLTELTAEEQIAARERFGKYPWLHVDASSYRRYGDDALPFAHILGRMGPVDAEAIANDSHADDIFARYLPGERVGISGIEWAAESRLRGRRGEVARDRQGALTEDIAAENGASVRMTIIGSLQRSLYDLLASAVEAHPDSNGGAIVVLDVHSREVLALVSYPSYDPTRFREEFHALRDNTEKAPLRFRAVTSMYQPGSTIKPLACLSGFINSIITTDSREECQGALFPDHPESWRCWEMHGTTTRKVHGLINAEEALTGSCNIFMFRLGEKLGVDRLTSTFDMAGIGRTTGIGLREEQTGINPTASWLMRNKNAAASVGAARQFAIGQAEISLTPVQVANLMATYVSGKYRPISLFLDGTRTPEWTLPGTAEQWAAIRRGIYGVVNDPEGTAYKYAHFENERYALCGKTGSATVNAWPTAYRIAYVDEYHKEREAIISEGAKGPAIERFRTEYPLASFDPKKVEVARRWPEHSPAEGGNHAHAWFGGYLQKLDATGLPDWSQTPRVAFAALVEFGGSGGRTSGPLAKEIAAVLLELLGPDLDAHATGAGL